MGWAITKIPARAAAALAIAAVVPVALTIRRTSREFPLAIELSLRTIATARRTVGKLSLTTPSLTTSLGSRAFAAVAKTLAAGRIGSLLTVPVTRRVGLSLAELSLGGSRRRTGSAAIVTIEPRPVSARLESALLAVASARGPVRKRPIATGALIPAETRLVAIGAARSVTVVATARRPALAEGAPVAIGFAAKILAKILAAKAAFGELLLRTSRCAGTALGAGRPIAPAAGIVVFVAVAGHERSH
jgi:hypothetical protein